MKKVLLILFLILFIFSCGTENTEETSLNSFNSGANFLIQPPTQNDSFLNDPTLQGLPISSSYQNDIDYQYLKNMFEQNGLTELTTLIKTQFEENDIYNNKNLKLTMINGFTPYRNIKLSGKTVTIPESDGVISLDYSEKNSDMFGLDPYTNEPIPANLLDNRTFVIIGWKVILESDVNTNGASLWIIADELVTNEHKIITTPQKTPERCIYDETDEDSICNKDGYKGNNAGDVVLAVNILTGTPSVEAKGINGETGGNGIQAAYKNGVIPKKCVNAEFIDKKHETNTSGGNGGKGGDGGNVYIYYNYLNNNIEETVISAEECYNISCDSDKCKEAYSSFCNGTDYNYGKKVFTEAYTLFNGTEENDFSKCTDGIDNDGNGKTDCQESGCRYNPLHTACSTEKTLEACSDGIDNDGDGYIDCYDVNCRYNPFVKICDYIYLSEGNDSLCSDGKDNDGNGKIDCNDYSCNHNPYVNVCNSTHFLRESSNATCSDGINNDGDSITTFNLNGNISYQFTDCEDFGCQNNPLVTQCRCPEITLFPYDTSNIHIAECQDNAGEIITVNFENSIAKCTDGIDNDNDELVDCADPHCFKNYFFGEFICNNISNENLLGGLGGIGGSSGIRLNNTYGEMCVEEAVQPINGIKGKNGQFYFKKVDISFVDKIKTAIAPYQWIALESFGNYYYKKGMGEKANFYYSLANNKLDILKANEHINCEEVMSDEKDQNGNPVYTPTYFELGLCGISSKIISKQDLLLSGISYSGKMKNQPINLDIKLSNLFNNFESKFDAFSNLITNNLMIGIGIELTTDIANLRKTSLNTEISNKTIEITESTQNIERLKEKIANTEELLNGILKEINQNDERVEYLKEQIKDKYAPPTLSEIITGVIEDVALAYVKALGKKALSKAFDKLIDKIMEEGPQGVSIGSSMLMDSLIEVENNNAKKETILNIKLDSYVSVSMFAYNRFGVLKDISVSMLEGLSKEEIYNLYANTAYLLSYDEVSDIVDEVLSIEEPKKTGLLNYLASISIDYGEIAEFLKTIAGEAFEEEKSLIKDSLSTIGTGILDEIKDEDSNPSRSVIIDEVEKVIVSSRQKEIIYNYLDKKIELEDLKSQLSIEQSKVIGNKAFQMLMQKQIKDIENLQSFCTNTENPESCLTMYEKKFMYDTNLKYIVSYLNELPELYMDILEYLQWEHLPFSNNTQDLFCGNNTEIQCSQSYQIENPMDSNINTIDYVSLFNKVVNIRDFTVTHFDNNDNNLGRMYFRKSKDIFREATKAEKELIKSYGTINLGENTPVKIAVLDITAKDIMNNNTANDYILHRVKDIKINIIAPDFPNYASSDVFLIKNDIDSFMKDNIQTVEIAGEIKQKRNLIEYLVKNSHFKSINVVNNANTDCSDMDDRDCETPFQTTSQTINVNPDERLHENRSLIGRWYIVATDPAVINNITAIEYKFIYSKQGAISISNYCGDGTVNEFTEQCEINQTIDCMDLSNEYAQGNSAKCNPWTCSWDTSECIATSCNQIKDENGNTIENPYKECDVNSSPTTCSAIDENSVYGVPVCNTVTCTYDKSDCLYLKNNIDENTNFNIPVFISYSDRFIPQPLNTIPFLQPKNQKYRTEQTAKSYMHSSVYTSGYRQSFYCGCSYDETKTVDINNCGYTPVSSYQTYATKIEWEHSLPASLMGQTFDEYVNHENYAECNGSQKPDGTYYPVLGGRECAQKLNVEYKYMTADMYNLYPAIGQLNRLRSDKMYSEIEGENSPFGSCDFEYNSTNAEPRSEIKGDIARNYFYMYAAYPGRILLTASQWAMFLKWNHEDPINYEECSRARRVQGIQQNVNRILDEACSTIFGL